MNHSVARSECRSSFADDIRCTITPPPSAFLLAHHWTVLVASVETLPGTDEPLEADLYDGPRRIAVEFVSRRDYWRVGGSRPQSTVQTFGFVEVARQLADNVRANGKDVYFGTFYDPLTEVDTPEHVEGQDWREAWLASGAQAMDRSRELLRAQVKDFVVWLRDRGAI